MYCTHRLRVFFQDIFDLMQTLSCILVLSEFLVSIFSSQYLTFSGYEVYKSNTRLIIQNLNRALRVHENIGWLEDWELG